MGTLRWSCVFREPVRPLWVTWSCVLFSSLCRSEQDLCEPAGPWTSQRHCWLTSFLFQTEPRVDMSPMRRVFQRATTGLFLKEPRGKTRPEISREVKTATWYHQDQDLAPRSTNHSAILEKRTPPALWSSDRSGARWITPVRLGRHQTNIIANTGWLLRRIKCSSFIVPPSRLFRPRVALQAHQSFCFWSSAAVFFPPSTN